jgi:NAD(P)-dependent dehydrogenase (short-subunit alcohol dehydrogenase family)
VSDEAQVLRFRDEVLEQHASDHVDLVFSNAGIGGGGSFVSDRREESDDRHVSAAFRYRHDADRAEGARDEGNHPIRKVLTPVSGGLSSMELTVK